MIDWSIHIFDRELLILVCSSVVEFLIYHTLDNPGVNPVWRVQLGNGMVENVHGPAHIFFLNIFRLASLFTGCMRVDKSIIDSRDFEILFLKDTRIRKCRAAILCKFLWLRLALMTFLFLILNLEVLKKVDELTLMRLQVHLGCKLVHA